MVIIYRFPEIRNIQVFKHPGKLTTFRSFMTRITGPLNGKCGEEHNASAVSCIQPGSQGFLLAQGMQHIIFNKGFSFTHLSQPMDDFFTPVELRLVGDRDRSMPSGGNLQFPDSTRLPVGETLPMDRLVSRSSSSATTRLRSFRQNTVES